VRRPLTILPALPPRASASGGNAELVIDAAHFSRIIREGVLQAKVSIDIMTADFKALLVPEPVTRRADSSVTHFRRLAARGVEIRLLHAGVPSSAALRELKRELPRGLTIRRCPRLHAKTVILDCRRMYLGSANLTGAGLGAKADGRRNFEMGIWTESPALIDSVLELPPAGHLPRSTRRARFELRLSEYSIGAHHFAP
jgi:phosphatidylserine/phosphatidylglycerophosphate/cardiolipin synthase-like enzyme